jgi:hypothetical protein
MISGVKYDLRTNLNEDCAFTGGSLYSGIMPFVNYANCPAQFCPGIVIPAREMNARQIFDKPSGIWNLQCSVCLHKFSIAEIHLKSDEFSLAKLRQLYPEAARS